MASASLEPAALAVAVREVTGRRVRIIGAPDLPVLGPLAPQARRARTAPRTSPRSCAPVTWRPRRWRLRGCAPGAGEPPRALLAAILGFPVIPVAVVPGGPVGLPLRPWRVIVGEMVETETDAVPGDALVAAELAERVRDAVRAPARPGLTRARLCLSVCTAGR